jgi:NDP-sugar pyrophosphorylase family protein
MLVVVPSAGIGSRLDLHTENFNKSMIQLGDTPVISKIIDSYPSNAKFIIIIGYKGVHIEQYLRLVYPKKKIKIVKVKLFDGPGSSLSHSLSQALKFIKKSFFFHANDTIFTDKNFYSKISNDTLFLHKKNCDTMKYATVEFNRNYKKIHNKLNYQRKDYFNYTGVGFIKDFKKFKKLIQNFKTNDGELSYFKSLPPNNINYRFVNGWHDIGSKETKERAENFFSNSKNILPKYDQGIFFKKNKVYKFFTNKDIVKKRYERSKILKPHVPKIIKKLKYFYVYNFHNGTIFSKLRNKRKEFRKLLSWLNITFWKKRTLSKNKSRFFQNKCNSFYYEKTLSRINYLYEKNNINDQIEFINNVKTPKLSLMLKQINWEQINAGVPVNFHGDLHFENIIKKKNKITLLDWREDFSGIKNYGDIYYDLAKINHGLLIDHNVIKKSKFFVKIDKKNIKINFMQSKENKDCQKIFIEFLKDNNFSLIKVKIITSLIFLNIAGLHHYPYSIFLYYLGKSVLYQTLKKKN